MELARLAIRLGFTLHRVSVVRFVTICTHSSFCISAHLIIKKPSEYDQEIPQSHTE